MSQKSEETVFFLKLNVFEAGVLTSFLDSNRDERSEQVLKKVWQQLLFIQNELREKAGVKVEKLPNGFLKLTARDGTTIIREPYSWEKG